MSGAVAAPIYPSSTPAECAYVLEHANAVGCLVDGELREKIDGVELEHVFERERLDELRALGREHAEQEPRTRSSGLASRSATTTSSR